MSSFFEDFVHRIIILFNAKEETAHRKAKAIPSAGKVMASLLGFLWRNFCGLRGET